MTSFFGSRDGDNSCNFLMDCQNDTLGFEKYTGASLTGSADSMTNFCLKILLSIPAHSLFELDPVMTLAFMTSFFGSRDRDKSCNLLKDFQNNSLVLKSRLVLSSLGQQMA